ncbi:hypothetical protein ABT330_05650 [Streptomyces sp. NPDC000658]|uniref:hypothetical protein n=1 Tax=Streptomyces sp. NPDC000658 TaxID=3154266 RepID=UPI003323526E
MTTTPQVEAAPGAGGTQAAALQLSELVLKTARGPNNATAEEEAAFMSGPVFAANPSGLELDPDRFAARFRAGDSERELLRLDNRSVAL